MNSQNTELSIPRETMVVDYVAGRLSGSARAQFESKLATDAELREAVEFEQQLRLRASQALASSPDTQASDNFAELLERIEAHEQVERDLNTAAPGSSVQNSASTKSSTTGEKGAISHISKHRATIIPLAASVAMVGVLVTLLVKPLSQQHLEPNFQGLSDGSTKVNSEPLNLTSLASQGRIAKVVLAERLEDTEVAEMLAAYQLQLLSLAPEQNALIVLADQQIDLSMLKGINNDSRIGSIDLVSYESPKTQ